MNAPLPSLQLSLLQHHLESADPQGPRNAAITTQWNALTDRVLRRDLWVVRETSMARSSGVVVAAELWKSGRVRHCSQGPVITHTHPITLI
jgi:hypothetical protein